MSQNQEIIESKLCAYIDGELDADGRTEIEKHLDANPQHRRLLESLKATRDLIKWLPREPAPPELAETLNGQLERSVLLDFDERSLNRKIGPRLLSAAAIVLLTAGLGAAVYFTLPKSQKNATPYAVRSGDAQSPMPDGPIAESAPDAPKPDDAIVAVAPLMAKASPPALEDKVSADRAPNPELDRLASDVSQNQAAIVAAANGTRGDAHPILPNTLVVLVRADSTDQATHDVTTYLQSQNIEWKSAAASAAEPTTSQAAGQLGEDELAKMRLGGINRDAREAALAVPTTRADVPAGAFAALNQPLGTPTQPTAPFPTGVYVARMSRQQAIDLNNSVQQGRSSKSELKDLTATADGTDSLLGQRNFQQAQGAVSAITSAPAALRPSQLSTPSDQSGAGPTTSRALGAVYGGGMGGGGGGGRGGLRARAATTEASTSQAAIESVSMPVDVVIVVQSDSTPTTQAATAAAQTEPASSQPATVLQLAPQSQPASH